LNDLVSTGQGGINGATRFLFVGNQLLLTSQDSDQVMRFDVPAWAAFTVSLSSKSAFPVTIQYSTTNGSALAGGDYQAVSGTITPGETSRTIIVKTLDDAIYEGNETFTVNLSNPVGATIADSQGVATVIDNDPQPTKFYVVNDGSPDRTYEYGATGAAVENYA